MPHPLSGEFLLNIHLVITTMLANNYWLIIHLEIADIHQGSRTQHSPQIWQHFIYYESQGLLMANKATMINESTMNDVPNQVVTHSGNDVLGTDVAGPVNAVAGNKLDSQKEQILQQSRSHVWFVTDLAELQAFAVYCPSTEDNDGAWTWIKFSFPKWLYFKSVIILWWVAKACYSVKQKVTGSIFPIGNAFQLGSGGYSTASWQVVPSLVHRCRDGKWNNFP